MRKPNSVAPLEVHIPAKPSRLFQYISTFSATLAGIALGSVVAYTSPAGPKLQNATSLADGYLTITEDQYNWFAASVNLAGALGAVLCGFSINTFGRKGSILVVSGISVAGWVVIAAAPNFALLMVGRTLTGMSMGASPVVVPSYIAEISSPEIKGKLGGLFMVSVCVGNLLIYSVGAVLDSWRWIAGVGALPSALCFTFMLFARESPYYLCMKGKDRLAKETLQHYRGKHYDVSDEFSSMHKFLEDQRSKSKGSFQDLLLPYNMKPFLIALSVLLFCQLSGISSVLFNMESIFEEAGTEGGDLSTIIIGVEQVVVTLIASSLVDRLGRKILLLISTSVMSVSLVALGTYFYLKEQDADWTETHLAWLPLTSLFTFFIAMNIGVAPVQMIFLGEILPLEVKGIGGSLANMIQWIVAFVVTITFIPMKKSFGMYGTYWFYSLMCFFSLLFTIAFIPETKGKTIQEIARHFGNPSAGQDVVNQDKNNTIETSESVVNQDRNDTTEFNEGVVSRVRNNTRDSSEGVVSQDKNITRF